jgi:hypothetical protein
VDSGKPLEDTDVQEAAMAKQPEKTLETKPSTKPQTDDGWGPEELEKVLDKIP